MIDFSPILLTLKLAVITTIILFFVAIPISYWLAYTKSKIKPIVETLVSLPIVLPPTVIGFYLLIIFSPNNFLGEFLENTFDLRLVFSFEGLILASIIYSLPFMVHPLQSGLSSISQNLIDASSMLGKSKFETLVKVLLPNIKPSIITGIVLAFAHTLGEFGVVLMIGGNIPNKTKVASIAIYDAVESLEYGLANTYSLILFLIAFIILLVVYSVNGGFLKRFWK